MAQSATAAVPLCRRLPPLPLEVDFDGGRLTSDGGLAVGGARPRRRSGCAPRSPP